MTLQTTTARIAANLPQLHQPVGLPLVTNGPDSPNDNPNDDTTRQRGRRQGKWPE